MKKQKKASAKKPLYLQGILKTNQRGFGFVTQITDYPDVFIPKTAMLSAVEGDLVEISITHEDFQGKGPEGAITKVLERARTNFAVIITEINSKNLAHAYSSVLGHHRKIEVMGFGKKPLQVGDRILIEVKEWGSKTKPIKAKFYQLLGHISDPSVDINAALEEFSIRKNFPEEAVLEAKKFGKTVKKAQFKDRVDYTKQDCVTIDPKTAKDFDDCLYVEKDNKGIYHLYVHIADVAAYVDENSELDKEAFSRCNSTYFPGTCVPMLPEELSNGLCSLKPKVNRLAATVYAKFDPQGDLINYNIHRSVICSKHRFSYESAKSVLDKKVKSSHLKLLETMVELCNHLKTKRRERGSVDFAMPELVIEVDKSGEPLKTHVVEYDITHQMVEEFMLKANELVATHLDKNGVPSIFRIHEAPHQESYQDFIKLAKSLGVSLPVDPTVFDIQKMFIELENNPVARHLSVAFIRSMKLACYSEENVGHYGLGLTHYSHFTSPIRRYSDLVVQRLLFNKSHAMNLQEVAEKCSKHERISFKAEMSVKNLKKSRLLKKWLELDPKRIYDAIITKVKPFGFFFEMQDLGIEGMFHFPDLKDDYYIHDPKNESLTGRRTGKVLKVGSKIKVFPKNVDLVTQEILWNFKG
jgi:ribonuclease R